MRFVIAASVFVLASTPANANDKQVWGLTEAGKEIILYYGIPDSGAATLLFNCQAGKPVSVVTTVAPARLKKGQAAKITLTNGAASASYAGKVGHDDEEGYHVEALTPAEPKMLDVLRSGAALTIEVAGKKDRVPLSGAAKPLARFEAGCFKKR